MSKTHRRREEPDRKAAAVVAEKEKVVDLHGAMRDLIEDTDKYISDKFGDSPLPGTAPQGSKKTRRRDQGSISTTPTGTTFEEQTEPPIDDLHKSIEGLKEETGETLVKVQTAAEVGEKVQEAGFGSVYDTPEYREYVQSGQGIRQAMEAAPDTLTYITEAPEGYYYRGQDVQEHNAKVREYNHQVREYKRKLQDAYTQYRVGLITYDSYEVQRKSYEAQLKLYEAEMKRTAPQRGAFGDYLRSIGPPEPTEEQRMRMDAGMPLTGIPGPANVPPPGSISAKIQPIVQEGFERTLRFMELPFKTATEPIRDIATGFKLKSIEAEMEGEPWAGFGYYAAGTALKVVGAGIDVATFEYRPGLWVDVSRTLTGLAVNPEARTALIGEVARDPFGFTAEMVGGAYLGGALKKLPGKVYGEAELAYKTLKAQRGGTYEGLYGVSIKEPTWSEALGEWRAIKDTRYRQTYAAKATDITEFKFLEEAGITEFPEEVIGIEPTYRTFEKRWLKFEGEGIKGEMPYYGAKDVRPPGAEPEAFDMPDDWIMKQITREADTALPYEYGEEGGFLRVRGGYGGMKPFAEPKPPLPPRAEQLTVTAEAAPNTPILDLIGKTTRQTLSMETELQFIPDIKTITEHLAGFKFITPESIKPPSATFKLIDIGKAAILDKSRIKGIDKVFTLPTVSLKQLEQQIPDQLQKPLQIELPKLKQPQIPGLTPIQVQPPRLDEIQKPKLEHIQVPVLDLPQLTMPEIPVPEEPGPIYPPDPPYEPPDDTDPLLILGTGPMKRSKLRRRDSELMGWERREYRLPTPDSELFLGGGKSRRSKDNFLGFSKKRKHVDDDLLFPRKKKKGKGIDLL